MPCCHTMNTVLQHSSLVVLVLSPVFLREYVPRRSKSFIFSQHKAAHHGRRKREAVVMFLCSHLSVSVCQLPGSVLFLLYPCSHWVFVNVSAVKHFVPRVKCQIYHRFDSCRASLQRLGSNLILRTADVFLLEYGFIFLHNSIFYFFILDSWVRFIFQFDVPISGFIPARILVHFLARLQKNLTRPLWFASRVCVFKDTV